jgi:hypothetical protein
MRGADREGGGEGSMMGERRVNARAAPVPMPRQLPHCGFGRMRQPPRRRPISRLSRDSRGVSGGDSRGVRRLMDFEGFGLSACRNPSTSRLTIGSGEIL